MEKSLVKALRVMEALAISETPRGVSELAREMGYQKSNVHRILDDVLGGLKEREFESKNITIVKEYAENLPDILIDPDAIRQVFLNLVNNAGDAVTGPGTITVNTCVQNRQVRVTVKDTGEGIDPEHMKRLFDPFFTTKDVGKGTGLGLSVSRNIVELMGGRIDVASVKGVGSSFTVSLPVRKSGEKDNGKH